MRLNSAVLVALLRDAMLSTELVMWVANDVAETPRQNPHRGTVVSRPVSDSEG